MEITAKNLRNNVNKIILNNEIDSFNKITSYIANKYDKGDFIITNDNKYMMTIPYEIYKNNLVTHDMMIKCLEEKGFQVEKNINYGLYIYW